jgi:thymidylate kinase
MCRSEMEKLPSNFHVAIEGNIGAGKTTLLQGLKKWFSKNNIRANVLPEPVKEWVKFGKIWHKLFRTPIFGPKKL